MIDWLMQRYADTLERDLPSPLQDLLASTHFRQITSSSMSDTGDSPGGAANNEEQPKAEHLNIKVTDNNNEVFFKIKRTTQLNKLMNAFCERQGKSLNSVRFLFDGTRVNPGDTPDSVSIALWCYPRNCTIANICLSLTWMMEILSRFTKNRLEERNVKRE